MEGSSNILVLLGSPQACLLSQPLAGAKNYEEQGLRQEELLGLF